MSNELGFSGFQKQGKQQFKDLPPRPAPDKIPTREEPFWVPNELDVEEQNHRDIQGKIRVVRLISTVLPIIGILAITTAIIFVSIIVAQVYS